MVKITGQSKKWIMSVETAMLVFGKTGNVPNASIDVSTWDRYKTPSFGRTEADNEFSHVG